MRQITIPPPPELEEIKAAAQARRAAYTATAASPAVPPPLEKEILEEAARAIRAIPKGEIGGDSLVELRDSLARTLQSPTFARFRELVDQHNTLAIDPSSYTIRSVSFGIEAGIALGVGVQGSFGVAVPPGQWDNFEEYVVYITGSIEIGVIEGFLGGVVLGLYNVQPTDLSGGSYGFALDAGVIEEIEVEGSYQNIDITGFLGVSITEAGGEEDGFDGMYSYTFIASWDAPHVFQPEATNYMILNSIKCNKTGENGHDELYFKFTPDNGTTYRYPTHGHCLMADGDTWLAGRSIYFNNQVTVELWDEDDVNDDPRGSTTYKVSGFQGSVTVGDNGGQYVLNAVLNQAPPPFPSGMRINGTDISSSGPAACVFNNQLYAFWRGTNQYLYASASANGVTWPNGVKINTIDVTPHAPSAIAFNNQLFVFWTGMNNGVYWSASSSGEDGSWPNGIGLSGESTIATPMPCVFNNTLYLFWSLNAYPYSVVYSTFNPATNSWSAHQAVNSSVATSTGVAPVVFNGQLYLFWRNDASRQLYYTASANNSWQSVHVTNSNESTSCTPTACVYNGKLYVIFISTSPASNVRYMASSDGATFPASIVSSGTTATRLSPGASAFNNALSLFFTNPATQLCFTRANL